MKIQNITLSSVHQRLTNVEEVVIAIFANDTVLLEVYQNYETCKMLVT